MKFFSLPKLKIRRTLGYFYTFIILGAVISALGPTIDGLAGNVGRVATSLSFVFSFRAAGYLTGSVTGGFLYEKYSGNKILGAVLLLLVGVLWLTPELQSVHLLMVVIILTGLLCGASDVGSNTLLAFTHQENSGPYLNAMYLFAGIGSFLAPLYLGTVTTAWGYRGLALLTIPGALLLLATQSPKAEKSGSSTADKPLQMDLLVLFGLLSFLYIGLEVSYSGWIYTYLLKAFPVQPAAGYLLTSVFWGAVTFGRLVAIPLSTRLKHPVLIFSMLAAGFLSLSGLIIFPERIQAVWLATIGVGLSISAVFPTTFSYMQIKTNLSPKHNGLVWAAGSSGSITLPLLVGRQMGSSGPDTMPWILIVCFSAALVIFWMLVSRTRLKKTLPNLRNLK